MLKLLTAVALALALFSPAYAEDAAPQCRFTLDSAVASMKADTPPTVFIVIDDPDAVKALTVLLVAAGETVPDTVTRYVLATLGSINFYGAEVDRCLSPPLRLPIDMQFGAPTSARLSGRTSAGTFA